MGRSLKKRKLKKVRRVKVHRAAADTPSKKKRMKKWEWWLLGGAMVFAMVWLIFLGKSGGLSPQIDTSTPTAVESPIPATPAAQ